MQQDEERAQQAPAPDYRSELPEDVEICSCDEALALRAALDKMTRSRNDFRRAAEGLAREVVALRAALAEVTQ